MDGALSTSGSGGGGGKSVVNKAVSVPATATGTIWTATRLFSSSSTFQKNTGSDANLSATASTGAIAAATAIGAGNVQVLVLQETDPDGRGAIYKVTFTGAPTKPAVPAVTLTPGNGQISVAWVDGSNGGSTITSHKIYDNGVLIASPTGAGPYVISGLPNGTSHGPIQVSAVNGIGESDLSTGQSATPVAIVALLAGGRFATMGNAQGANGLSNGVNVNSNCRITSWNETGATINTMKLVYTNWADGGDNETSGTNPITYEASIEYPAGTFTRVTFNGGATSNTQAIDTTIQSDEVTLATPIPPNAQYWMRTYVTVSSGQRFPMGYIMNTGTAAEATDWDTGVNKVMSGTITHSTTGSAQRGFGPVAALAISVTGVRKAKAWAGIGDSIINGTKTAANFRNSIGWLGDAMYLVGLPYINISVPGAKIVNAGQNWTKRLDMLGKVGVTDAIVDYGVNDLSNNRTATQIIADLVAFHTSLQTKVARSYQTTITPYTDSPAATSGTDPGFWLTSSQTPHVGGTGPVVGPNQFAGGAASEWTKLNVAIRAKPSPITDYLETANAVTSAPDVCAWKTGSDASPPAQLLAPTLGAVVQSGSTTGVVNVTVPYGSNALINGGAVVFRTGANAGVIRQATSNTASSITLAGGALASAPAAGDTVDIYALATGPVVDGLHPAGFNPYNGAGTQSYGAAQILAQYGKTWLQANNW